MAVIRQLHQEYDVMVSVDLDMVSSNMTLSLTWYIRQGSIMEDLYWTIGFMNIHSISLPEAQEGVCKIFEAYQVDILGIAETWLTLTKVTHTEKVWKIQKDVMVITLCSVDIG
ncbi:hypothetical protein GGF37_002556 [Kickxella alabastrina]|nr:hypothetical protein GGF37_002556 [Kickxella alabastrina]